MVPRNQQAEIGGTFALRLPPPGHGLLSVGAVPVMGRCRTGPAFLPARGSQQAAAVLSAQQHPAHPRSPQNHSPVLCFLYIDFFPTWELSRQGKPSKGHTELWSDEEMVSF